MFLNEGAKVALWFCKNMSWVHHKPSTSQPASLSSSSSALVTGAPPPLQKPLMHHPNNSPAVQQRTLTTAALSRHQSSTPANSTQLIAAPPYPSNKMNPATNTTMRVNNNPYQQQQQQQQRQQQMPLQQQNSQRQHLAPTSLPLHNNNNNNNSINVQSVLSNQQVICFNPGDLLSFHFVSGGIFLLCFCFLLLHFLLHLYYGVSYHFEKQNKHFLLAEIFFIAWLFCSCCWFYTIVGIFLLLLYQNSKLFLKILLLI